MLLLSVAHGFLASSKPSAGVTGAESRICRTIAVNLIAFVLRNMLRRLAAFATLVKCALRFTPQSFRQFALPSIRVDESVLLFIFPAQAVWFSQPLSLALQPLLFRQCSGPRSVELLIFASQ
jgi:hypothetical protein